MPFGLTNAPTTFQAAMTTEFRHMLDRYVLIYLDDILVYSRSLEEHVEHLCTVLERLLQAKYKANRDKCEFARQELEYLGHYVTSKDIRPLADKIEALRVWPEPTNTTDVRSFMGLAGYYQRFITEYSRIAAPMTRLHSPKVPFVFDDDARRSFQALKTAMLMAPVLSIYDPTLPTRVTTDASGYGIGAVLEQHDDDDWHLVEYFSHKVPPINSLDDARKKELLAFAVSSPTFSSHDQPTLTPLALPLPSGNGSRGTPKSDDNERVEADDINSNVNNVYDRDPDREPHLTSAASVKSDDAEASQRPARQGGHGQTDADSVRPITPSEEIAAPAQHEETTTAPTANNNSAAPIAPAQKWNPDPKERLLSGFFAAKSSGQPMPEISTIRRHVSSHWGNQGSPNKHPSPNNMSPSSSSAESTPPGLTSDPELPYAQNTQGVPRNPEDRVRTFKKSSEKSGGAKSVESREMDASRLEMEIEDLEM
ncbi:hypothetical protein CBR_g24395 [Chara braunii]|uniref:Reverse transcriptase domain-containing protein n=1 Tax=Chara braunii TaxID=69332 RepID=A0A388JMK2_CHABU|nr:hypothetical protein CBR_g24395 [Chara braunii]|eukprot:GBG59049.1 hypothetical protein CBR_g24395 [Chara braunii]